MASLAALRAAVFSLSAKNRTGGLKSTPPPVRGLMRRVQGASNYICFYLPENLIQNKIPVALHLGRSMLYTVRTGMFHDDPCVRMIKQQVFTNHDTIFPLYFPIPD